MKLLKETFNFSLIEKIKKIASIAIAIILYNASFFVFSLDNMILIIVLSSAFQGVFTLKYELNTQLQKAEVKRPSAAEGIFFL
jgi:hypothetical protein